MAGLTHSSLVSLSERDAATITAATPPPPSVRSIPHLLGLAPNVRTLNVFALSSSAFFSISFLVFLNAAQPFVLTELLHIPTSRVGDLTGTLILADELLSLVLVFFWGALADLITVRPVASMGHLIIGVGLLLYPLAKDAIPGVLMARLVFATGASALVTALGAALAGMAAVPSSIPTPTERTLDEERPEEEVETTETTALLPHAQTTPTATNEPNPAHSARFAGILGFSTGSGALLAVFIYLRLPTLYASLYPTPSDPPLALQKGLRNTFFFTSLLAFLEGVFLFWGLKRRVMPAPEVAEGDDSEGESEDVKKEKEGLWDKVKEGARDLPRGVMMVKEKEGEVGLAYYSAFATRAQSVAVTAFIPLLINNYFLSHDRCDNPTSLLPSTTACQRAFTYSSTLTGIIQLLSLLLSPIIGYLSSHIALPLLLAFTSLLGAFSFLLFSTLEDPENGWVWAAAIGMGISQIGGIVVGLALVARCRTDLIGRASAQKGIAKEVGGAISGAYSAAGGLGILILGKLGGSLFDKWSRAPFLIVGVFDLILAMMAAIIYGRGYKRSNGKGKGKGVER